MLKYTWSSVWECYGISCSILQSIDFKTHRLTAEKFDEQFVLLLKSFDDVVDVNRFHVRS